MALPDSLCCRPGSPGLLHARNLDIKSISKGVLVRVWAKLCNKEPHNRTRLCLPLPAAFIPAQQCLPSASLSDVSGIIPRAPQSLSHVIIDSFWQRRLPLRHQPGQLGPNQHSTTCGSPVCHPASHRGQPCPVVQAVGWDPGLPLSSLPLSRVLGPGRRDGGRAPASHICYNPAHVARAGWHSVWVAFGFPRTCVTASECACSQPPADLPASPFPAPGSPFPGLHCWGPHPGWLLGGVMPPQGGSGLLPAASLSSPGPHRSCSSPLG